MQVSKVSSTASELVKTTWLSSFKRFCHGSRSGDIHASVLLHPCYHAMPCHAKDASFMKIMGEGLQTMAYLKVTDAAGSSRIGFVIWKAELATV